MIIVQEEVESSCSTPPETSFEGVKIVESIKVSLPKIYCDSLFFWCVSKVFHWKNMGIKSEFVSSNNEFPIDNFFGESTQ